MNKTNETAAYHIHITSKHRLLDLNLKEVWKYRDLIVLFTKRTFTLTYKQTVLGPAWLFLNPLISSIIPENQIRDLFRVCEKPLCRVCPIFVVPGGKKQS